MIFLEIMEEDWNNNVQLNIMLSSYKEIQSIKRSIFFTKNIIHHEVLNE